MIACRLQVMSPSKLKSTLKTLAFLAGALVLLIGIAWLWVVSIRERRWAEMEAGIRELRTGMDAPPLQRVPLDRPLLDPIFPST